MQGSLKVPPSNRSRSNSRTSFSLIIPQHLAVIDPITSKSVVEYAIHVQNSESITLWEISRRYSCFVSLRDKLLLDYNEISAIPFPKQQLYLTDGDIERRRRALESWLQTLLTFPQILNSFELQFFLETKQQMPSRNVQKRVLIVMPEQDFDPSQVSIVWKMLKLEGKNTFDVVFASKEGLSGNLPTADQQLLNTSIMNSRLGIKPEYLSYYQDLLIDKNFNSPISWSDINPEEYCGIYLPGGNGNGVKTYLEDIALRQKIEAFWKFDRPIAALCRGTLLLARCVNNEGISLLHNKRTTTLPKKWENLFWYITNWKQLYPESCEDEIRSVLANPLTQCETGSLLSGLSTEYSVYNDSHAFVVEDKNYISGRWAGDSFLLAKRFIAQLHQHTMAVNKKLSLFESIQLARDSSSSSYEEETTVDVDEAKSNDLVAMSSSDEDF